MPYSFEFDGVGVTLTDNETGEDIYLQGDDALDFLEAIGATEDVDDYNEDALEAIGDEYFGY